MSNQNAELLTSVTIRHEPHIFQH